LVDSLDSEVWTVLDAELLLLPSSSTEAVGQSFRQLFTTRSAQQPDGRATHNQEA